MLLVLWNRQLNPDGTPALAANGEFKQHVGKPPRPIRVRIEPILAEGQHTLWQISIRPATPIRRALAQMSWTMPDNQARTDTAVMSFRELADAINTVNATARRVQEISDHEEAYAKNDPDLATLTRQAEEDMNFFPIHYNRDSKSPGR